MPDAGAFSDRFESVPAQRAARSIEDDVADDDLGLPVAVDVGDRGLRPTVLRIRALIMCERRIRSVHPEHSPAPRIVGDAAEGDGLTAARGAEHGDDLGHPIAVEVTERHAGRVIEGKLLACLGVAVDGCERLKPSAATIPAHDAEYASIGAATVTRHLVADENEVGDVSVSEPPIPIIVT